MLRRVSARPGQVYHLRRAPNGSVFGMGLAKSRKTLSIEEAVCNGRVRKHISHHTFRPQDKVDRPPRRRHVTAAVSDDTAARLILKAAITSIAGHRNRRRTGERLN